MMLLACVYVEIEVDKDMNWSTHATGVLRHQGEDNKNILTHKYLSIKHKSCSGPFFRFIWLYFHQLLFIHDTIFGSIYSNA